MKYYHITRNDKAIIKDILNSGLKANEFEEIFLFENKSIGDKNSGIINTIADCIADGQLILSEYVMFEIDSDGLTTKLEPDNVAEFSAKCQWIAKQPLIKSNYINLFGCYKNEYKCFYPEYQNILKSLNLTNQ